MEATHSHLSSIKLALSPPMSGATRAAQFAASAGQLTHMSIIELNPASCGQKCARRRSARSLANFACLWAPQLKFPTKLGRQDGRPVGGGARYHVSFPARLQSGCWRRRRRRRRRLAQVARLARSLASQPARAIWGRQMKQIIQSPLGRTLELN